MSATTVPTMPCTEWWCTASHDDKHDRSDIWHERLLSRIGEDEVVLAALDGETPEVTVWLAGEPVSRTDSATWPRDRAWIARLRAVTTAAKSGLDELEAVSA